jgi:hypothetical protein
MYRYLRSLNVLNSLTMKSQLASPMISFSDMMCCCWRVSTICAFFICFRAKERFAASPWIWTSSTRPNPPTPNVVNFFRSERATRSNSSFILEAAAKVSDGCRPFEVHRASFVPRCRLITERQDLIAASAKATQRFQIAYRECLVQELHSRSTIQLLHHKYFFRHKTTKCDLQEHSNLPVILFGVQRKNIYITFNSPFPTPKTHLFLSTLSSLYLVLISSRFDIN